MLRGANLCPRKALAVLCKPGLECIQYGKSCTVLIDQQMWQMGESLPQSLITLSEISVWYEYLTLVSL